MRSRALEGAPIRRRPLPASSRLARRFKPSVLQARGLRCVPSLQIPNTTVTGAVYVTSPSGNYCQVNATVVPEHDVQINLPDNWKSRYLQTGGGGFDGQVPRAGSPFAAAGNDLVANGYVVTADNGGHRGSLHPVLPSRSTGA